MDSAKVFDGLYMLHMDLIFPWNFMVFFICVIASPVNKEYQVRQGNINALTFNLDDLWYSQMSASCIRDE
jgi:hypothetical protein